MRTSRRSGSHLNDRDYRVEMKRISADIITQGVNILAKDYNSSLVAMYMFDETDIKPVHTEDKR